MSCVSLLIVSVQNRNGAPLICGCLLSHLFALLNWKLIKKNQDTHQKLTQYPFVVRVSTM